MRSSTTSPKAALAAHGLSPKKHFGQNFMVDSGLCDKIAELAMPDAVGTALEIGAGLGALTSALAKRATRVIAIERDRDLVPVLNAQYGPKSTSSNVDIVEADAKSTDWMGLLGSAPPPHVICGNLPYQLTGPLLEKTVHVAPRIERAVYLVQLEVARRLVAAPATSEYGALSVFVQAAYEPRRAMIVRSGAFYPVPRVDSAVVVLEPRQPPRGVETTAFRAVVRAAFGQRRKTLRRAWKGLLGLSDAGLSEAAERAGIDLGARGETLDVAAFERMAAEMDT